jgi:GxxExxY protein
MEGAKRECAMDSDDEREKKRMALRIKSSLSPELEALIQQVIGAAIEVHRHLGPGFVEKVYERALVHELKLQGIRIESQKALAVPYKDILITGQQLDLLVEGQLILELKAVDQFSGVHEAQAMSYLKATGLRAALLLNFNVKMLKEGGIKRIVR